uniref:Vasoactive intestinal peptide receptor 2 n=1 Tax=Prolemur simus TaxID=1328070 RepID=A0A8C9ACW8_PROSS
DAGTAHATPASVASLPCAPARGPRRTHRASVLPACSGVWDNLTCWRPADVGETVTVPCPKVFSNFYSKVWGLSTVTLGRQADNVSELRFAGNISKNCTSDGWSAMFPDFVDACGYSDPEDESKVRLPERRSTRRSLGRAGQRVSPRRKLRCTRNYIHLNLFLSFMLRAVSVLVKDDVLFSSSGTLHCRDQPSSWVGCKLSLVFFQYCTMANFYWLLAEGLYLHTLLVAMFSPGRCFLAYLLLGWGIPTVCVAAWAVARLHLEDTGPQTPPPSLSWESHTNTLSLLLQVNFVLFISIIRILLQKLTSPDVGGNDQSQYKLRFPLGPARGRPSNRPVLRGWRAPRCDPLGSPAPGPPASRGGAQLSPPWRRRLAKSTLLLIPLFGIHYVVFAVSPVSGTRFQILFELCLGSFQGLAVAVLYCFLNGEVRCELRRKWRGRCRAPPAGRDYRIYSTSASRHGSEGALRLHRGSRAAADAARDAGCPVADVFLGLVGRPCINPTCGPGVVWKPTGFKCQL